MKLRNKETGKIREFEFVVITKDMDAEFAKYAHHAPVMICRSIDQLNEGWEDYKPAEPLITDEKVRKAVRAWAEANGEDGQTRLEYRQYDGRFSTDSDCIEFSRATLLVELKDGTYTIAELCGEEEL